MGVLKTLPDESIDCVITSPPYYSLRDYGVEGQLGLEKSLSEYLDKMLLVTAELHRVLKDVGTLWWNHGDNYSHKQSMGNQGKNGGRADRRFTVNGIPGRTDTPEKSLTLQAHRLAVRMIDEQGWILRNQIIWHKPNVMPASVKDRFTVDFEPIFFFTKSKKYYFEQQLEKSTYTDSRLNKGRFIYKGKRQGKAGTGTAAVIQVTERKNKRAVWQETTRPFEDAHFATFPETLIETPVRAGCPPGGGRP